MSKRRRRREAEDDVYERLTPTSTCTVTMPGTRKDLLNWLTGEGLAQGQRKIDDEIGDQGDGQVCWAWNATKEADVAFEGADYVGVSPLSVQDTMDHSHHGNLGRKGGSCLVALQWIQTEGVSREVEYTDYSGKKPKTTPPRREGTKHKINAWSLVRDNEDDMIAALKKQAIIVSVYCYSGFILLGEDGLLDLELAEKTHDVKRLLSIYKKEGDIPSYHSLLLVGYGTFTPEDTSKPPINYWILKNQWKTTWGKKGLALVIRNSSLLDIHRDSLSTENTAEDLARLYSPIIAYVNRDGEQAATSPLALEIEKDKTIDELITYVTGPEYLDRTLIYIFYDQDYCLIRNIDIDQIVTGLARAFALEPENIIAQVRLTPQSSFYESFKIHKKNKLVVMVYKSHSEARSVKDAKRFPGSHKISFDRLMDWMEKSLDMAGSFPSFEHA